MFLTTAHKELVSKVVPQVVEPSVVVSRLTDPDGAGVVLVCNLVAVFSPGTVCHTMCGGQQLSVLDHHFGAMNIGVVDCCLLRAFVKVENIHFLVQERDNEPSRSATYYISLPRDFNEKEEKQPEEVFK
jgi:hypothetical protein